MKKLLAVIGVTLLITLVYTRSTGQAPVQSERNPQRYEYASVRWAGKNTCFVWPDGKAEKLYALMPDLKRPSDADDRVFHLTMAMNVAAQRGFEVGGAGTSGSGPYGGGSTDDIFFRRPVSR